MLKVGLLKFCLSAAMNQPTESDRQAQNLWIIVGVAVPVLVVTIIIVILYWKLCRTDKLDFQPDTMSNLQQRQKVRSVMRVVPTLPKTHYLKCCHFRSMVSQ